MRLRLGGLSADEISEFVRSAARRRARPGAARGRPRRCATLTGGNAFLMTELWRTLVETGAACGRRRRRPAGAARSPSSAAPRASARSSASGWRGSTPPRPRCSSSPRSPGRSSTSRWSRRRAGRRASSHAALEQAVAHGMIEEVPARRLAYRFTHELVRRALYDRMPGAAARRAAPAGRRGARAAHGAASSRGLAELAHHFAAAAPVDGAAARGRVLAAGRAAPRWRRSTSTRPRRASRPRSSSASTIRGGGPRRSSSSAPRASAPGARTTRWRRSAPPPRSPASSATREMLATAAVGFEEACWRPAHHRRGARRAARGGVDGARRRGLRAARDAAGRPRPRPCVPRQLRGQRGRRASSAIAMARRLDDRFGLATVLMRSYWSRGERSLEQTLEMLSEARDLAEELGETDMQAEAMEWRIAGLIVLGELTAAERELAEVLELAVRLRQPFTLHVAEHYASTLALCFGRLGGRRGGRAALARVEPAADGPRRLGHYGIQMFGIRREQGRLAELAPAIRSVASGGQAERRLAARARRAARRAGDGGRGAPGARPGPQRGIRRAALRALAGVAHVSRGRLRRSGRRRAGGDGVSRSSRRSPGATS